jgi:hypothetical protein
MLGIPIVIAIRVAGTATCQHYSFIWKEGGDQLSIEKRQYWMTSCGFRKPKT